MLPFKPFSAPRRPRRSILPCLRAWRLRQRRTRLIRAAHALPSRERDAFLLRVRDGVPIAVIAERQGISAADVEHALAAALVLLADKLDGPPACSSA